jgi:hypothetical protein
MIRIGITGHRPHRLIVPEPRLARRVEKVLASLHQAAGPGRRRRDPRLDIVSPLAEGCDRIVARAALGLGLRLTVLLPFARRDYEATFADPATIPEFRRLLKAAHARTDLAASPRHREAGYVAVGMATLAMCDIVLTIWDGKPAAGRGGTPEILENAIGWGIPVIWIDAARDRPPVLLGAPRRAREGARLDAAARRAKRWSAALARRVVAQISERD